MQPDDPSQRWVVVGRVVGPHGIRGELKVRCDRPSESVLLQLPEVRLGDSDTSQKLLSARSAHAELLIRLHGIGDRTAAEALGRADVLVQRSAFPEAEADEVYHADLAGLQAVDEAGNALGEVQGLWETGPVPVLVVGTGPDELLVPFAEPFVVSVRVAQGQIVLRPPEYEP